ncbi:DUF167 domain-containing protein [Sphingomonas glacialis]|uniref:UPF0235 protein EAH76_04295 n=1 Tax=Sphingomonas glacialis TaxID=658225 RepID=A0A502FXZ5_9SPHN|nr:DUF167 domain-containing protein [Sphingomonas glacialis]TPG53936.1 DUF167 domain-containing protein [Sphingomonas glacialis]
MSRVKHRLPDRAAVLALVDERGQIAVRATPNASANTVVLPAAGAPRVLSVRTTVTPEDGKANDAILALLAEALGCPKSALTLVRGATARDKVVQVAR